MKQKKTVNFVVFIILIIISLSFATGISILYSQTATWADSDTGATVRIHPDETKNPASWGKELRVYYITLNHKSVDFTKLKLSKGWTYDGNFLFYNGQGDDLSIPFDRKLTNLKIRYCKQEGSGRADIIINDGVVESIDLYDEEWVQEEYTKTFMTKDKLLAFGLSVALFTFLLLFIVFKQYIKDISRIFEEDDFGKIKKNINSLGMFDYFKGIGIILVILYHTDIMFNMDSEMILRTDDFVSLLQTILVNGLMPAFIIISGYGYKVSPVRKYAGTMTKLLLIPYCYVAIAVSVISFTKCFIRKGSFSDTFITYTLPYITDANKIGPMWFILALCLGLLLLNLIMNLKKTWVKNLLIIIIYVTGATACAFEQLPAIINMTFTAVGYIYLGYSLKKTKWLLNMNWRKTAVMAGLGGLMLVLSLMYSYSEQIPNILKIFDVNIISIICGFLLVHVALWLNKFTGRITNMIRIIGRYSLWILCIHTIEDYCIPWFDLTKIFGYQEYLVMSITLVLRIPICFLGCYILCIYQRRKKYVSDLRTAFSLHRS